MKIKGRENNDIATESKFNCITKINANTSKANKQIKADFELISLLAKGLELVLLTFLSKFLSKISLIMHPADRITKAPQVKINNKRSCNSPSLAINKAVKTGQSKRKKPAGL